MAITTTLGGYLVAGGKIKEPGTEHWTYPNTGADNSSGFTALASGIRIADGTCDLKGLLGGIWITSGSTLLMGFVNNTDALLAISEAELNVGLPIRFVKDTSDWTSGETVKDYDGNIYGTIKIGDLVITTSNFIGIHYNTGDAIPHITDNTAWSEDSVGCYSEYITATPVVETASTDPTTLSWDYDEVETQTFTVTTNLTRWYFGSGCNFGDFDVKVYDSTNTTEVTDGIYLDQMVVRVTPLWVNYGSSNNVCVLAIANSSNVSLCFMTGVQLAVVSELSIYPTGCRYHYNGTPYDTNIFTVTHTASYTVVWTYGTYFDFVQNGDIITVTAKGTNSSGDIYSDELIITQGSLVVTFGVVQFISPN
jgi:hypothetical protein